MKIPSIKIDKQKFSEMINIDSSSLTPECRNLIELYNLEYRHLDRCEFEDALAEIFKHAQRRKQSKSGKARKQEWEAGWKQNLDLYAQDKDIRRLKPGYFRHEEYLRLDGTYVKSLTDDFVFKFLKILQAHIYISQIRALSHIFELGCGSGHNLASLSELLPDHKFVGLDWTQCANDLVTMIGHTLDRSIKGSVFDLFSPEDYNINVPENSAFITTGALEQIGDNHEKLLNFIIDKKPQKVINLEPIHEFYNEDNLSDLISLEYHLQRGYLKNYYTTLLELQDKGLIEIEVAQKVNFGGLFHDGWSILVWRPL